MKVGIITVLMGVVLSSAAYAEKALVPFGIDWSKISASAIDLSHFLDAPAGKDGFLKVQGKHIVTPGGKRFRFWGVNICGPDCFPDKDMATKIAGDLARMGVNCVRFHHMDSDWGRSAIDLSRDDTRHLDVNNMDLFDFFVAELKKRGIYSNINLNVLRKYKAGDEVRDYKILGIGKSATYFDKRLIELQHEYATQIMTHLNKYTGNEYRNEPAIAVVEIVNENSLLEGWLTWRLVGRDDMAGNTWSPIPISYSTELVEQYNAWLNKTRTPEELNLLRQEAQVEEDRPIPRLKPNEFYDVSKLRFHSEATFYMSVEFEFFTGMKKLLKDKLGVHSMLVGSADHNDSISAYLHICSNMMFDIIDAHGYWQHPQIGAETRIINTPMVNDPLDSTVTQFARTPVVGKPFTISETNHPFPHEYACEGYPILTAYSLLHDWDGIYWFSFGQGRRNKPGDGIQEKGWFDFSNDPVKMTNLYACALMWHRQDLRPAKESLTRSYTSEQMIDSLRFDVRNRPFFTPYFYRTNPLRYATRLAVDGLPSSPYPLGGPISNIEADTGQISWRNADKSKGLVEVQADCVQALIGFVKDGDRSLNYFKADVTNDFCSLVLVSLDGKTIWQSSKLLLTATALATNTAIQWKEDRRTLANWGHGPIVIEPVVGSVTLRNIRRATKLTYTPLTGEGCPLTPESGQSENGRNWTLELGKVPTTWYIIDIKR